MINSYPSIYQVGHKAIGDILKTNVIVEEKVDGSQFSFSISDGVISCRSRRTEIYIDNPDGMFSRAIETIRKISHLLTDKWIYRGEYLNKPKHNTLLYGRVPNGNIIIFDIMTGVEEYLSYEDKKAEAERIGLEVVPLLFEGIIDSKEQLTRLLDTDSVLGNVKVEGVVVKNYELFTQEKKIAIAKLVSETFKEKHGGEWKKNNPSKSDVLDQIVDKYKHEMRWQKAIQHLSESGSIEGSPLDLGLLIKEIQDDVKAECEDEIKDILFAHFWPKIKRGIISGFPEWYKSIVIDEAFDE